jgi:hypothetical protein
MRTRQKLTAVGAITLATTAVVGGAVVTSHAMADSPIPAKGTMTVVSMTNGSDPIKCVYDNVDLPTPPDVAGQPHFSTGTPGEAAPCSTSSPDQRRQSMVPVPLPCWRSGVGWRRSLG